MCLWGVGYCTFILIFLWSCYVSWGGGGGLHCYNHFLELTALCGGGGGRTCIPGPGKSPGGGPVVCPQIGTVTGTMTTLAVKNQCTGAQVKTRAK